MDQALSVNRSTNRIRVFTDLLGIDAWYSRFTTNGRSQVHVELDFGEARVGGDDQNFQFTFRLRMRRALLTLEVQRPLEIERASIARNIPDTQTLQTRIRTVRESFEAGGKLSASISPAKFASALSGELGGSLGRSTTLKQTTIDLLPPILVSSRPSGAGRYSWTLEPTLTPCLEGQPWDPVNEPRMGIRHADGSIPNDPLIKIELSCAREDLVVTDIEKKKGFVGNVAGKLLSGDLRVKAAEQQIKKVLTEADLQPGELDNRFSSVLVASVLAAQEG